MSDALASGDVIEEIIDIYIDTMSNTIDKTKFLFGADSDDVSTLLNRIKYILRFYSEWMSNKHDDKEDMYSIIKNGFGTQTGYNLKSFLLDYHFMVDDKNRRLITTGIHNKKNVTVCDPQVCRVFERTRISKVDATSTEARQLYFYRQTDDDTDINKNISIQQILDSLHVFMYHTFRTYPMEYEQIEQETKDEEDDEDDKISPMIVNIIQKAKEQNITQIRNKFMTVNQYENPEHNMDETVDQSAVYGNEQRLMQKHQQVSDKACVLDGLFEKLSAKYVVDDTDRLVLKQFQSVVDNEEYDSDAITDDLDFQEEEQSNLKRILLHRFEIAALFMQQIKF
eukprot:940687_1